MQLATYIKDLLYRYECVIVPGFGAFLTQYQAARIEDNHTFYAPGKTLSFNRQLQTNDGILAHHVAAVENCSYELALQKVRNFSNELSKKLFNGETFELDKIGSFSVNKEKKIQFTPFSKENYSPSSFGLTSFVSPKIDRVKGENSEKLVTLVKDKKQSAIPYMKYAAIGLLAITLGGFSGLKIYEGEVEKYNFAEKQKANDLVETQIQEATFVIESFPTTTIAIPKQTGKYHVVAGAFRIEENAYKKVDQLSQKGYSARIIGVNKYGLHQVVYSSYEDRIEALQNLRKIQNTENKEAWLLVQEISE